MFLETKLVKKVYDNGATPFEALTDVNVCVEQGVVAALIGASGSGKTTLLNIIGALDTATEGDVVIDGESLLARKTDDLARFRRDNLGFIFQSYNLVPVLTAYENVALALFGMTENEKKDKVMAILKTVGLEGKEFSYPNQMSGGQQQRVSIARALVKKPKLLLADEPTANLDSKTGKQILELISDINKKEGITVLFSTHDSRVVDICDKVFTLEDGKIIKEQ